MKRTNVATLGFSNSSASVTGGAMAYIGLESHVGPGYQLHPAVADSAMHTGALNPASPPDGLTRVPAALAVYLVDPALCGGQMQRCGGMWAGVDTGSCMQDGSCINAYRCMCFIAVEVLCSA